MALRKKSYALPKEKKPVDANILHYAFLIYGREKIGKTTIFSTFPNALFFATEPGTKGLKIFEFNHEDGGVHNWEVLRAGVRLLKQTDQFDFVIIDTADRAYDMCRDWVCDQMNIPYPGENSSGKDDWGKSWNAVRQEFISQIHQIRQTGRGVGFTSHCREPKIKRASGDAYSRIEPSISKQAKQVIEALVDYFFYCEYVADMKGETQRVMICEGDELIWAGYRTGMVNTFPKFLPMEKEDGFKIIRQAFMGKHPGLDVKTLRPSRGATETGTNFLRKEQRKAVQKKVAKKKKGKK